MKLIIAGSRGIEVSPDLIEALRIHFGLRVSEIVSGCSKGIDESGEDWAAKEKVSVKRFPADWDKYGKAAGPIRNNQMAEYANELLLIWDGESKGSLNMKTQMMALEKPIHEVILKGGCV